MTRSKPMHASKITTKGQVTIPQKLRRLLGVRPGDKIAFEASDDGEVVIRKIDCRVSLAGLLNKQITKQATDQAIDDAIKHGWANRGSD
jgi:AbrB family looped-hinge helix DNA binding protein